MIVDAAASWNVGAMIAANLQGINSICQGLDGIK